MEKIEKRNEVNEAYTLLGHRQDSLSVNPSVELAKAEQEKSKPGIWISVNIMEGEQSCAIRTRIRV